MKGHTMPQQLTRGTIRDFGHHTGIATWGGGPAYIHIDIQNKATLTTNHHVAVVESGQVEILVKELQKRLTGTHRVSYSFYL